MADKNTKLSELYYDIESGFGSAKQLYNDARKAGLVITLEEVKEWLRSQTLKQRKNYKNFNSHSPPVYSVDLMNTVSLMKDTGAYKKDYPLYSFVCIDNFIQKCHVVVMENKDTDPVYDVFMECLKVVGHPQSIYSDDEGSFRRRHNA